MVDVNQAPFPWSHRPTTISWVDRLDAPTAAQQCTMWGILPAPTLAENRVILKNHLRGAVGMDFVTSPNSPRTPPSRPPTPILSPRSLPHPAPAAPQPPDWMPMVQATALAVGAQIAAALAQNNPINVNNNNHVPRVITDLVRDMPECSGGDSHRLLDFIIACDKLTYLDLADNRQLLVAILPKTSGQVRTAWVQAIADNTLLGQLCQDLVGWFMPDPIKHQLISDAVFRRQAPQETLTQYVTSVQEAARVLLPPNMDLLPTLRTKLNTRTRAQLAGQPIAETVEQLLQLAPTLGVIEETERAERQQTRASLTPPQHSGGSLRNPYPPLHRRAYYNSHAPGAQAHSPGAHAHSPGAHSHTRNYRYQDSRTPNRGAYNYNGPRVEHTPRLQHSAPRAQHVTPRGYSRNIYESNYKRGQ